MMTDDHIPLFEDLFNISEIQEIQDSFALATGVASIITDVNGHPITKPSNFCRLCRDMIRRTEKGLINCMQSDSMIGRYNEKGPTVQPCLSGGLWDAGVSIHVSGKHIANWLIGQVRNEDMDLDRISGYADIIGVDREEFLLALKEVTVMSPEQFGNIAKFLFLIANQLSEQAYQKVWNNHMVLELKKKNEDNAGLLVSLQNELDQRIRLEEEQKQLESKLRQSQKMEAIGTLAGGIAHDFNNILFPVIGFSEMVMGDLPEDSPLRNQMKTVLGGAYRARDLVQQILTFSRETELEYLPLKIQLILKEVLKLARASLPSTIKIRSDIPDKIGPVMADPIQIHQMGMNLVSNALHAMEESGGELRVTLSEIEVGNDGLHSSGMPPGSYVRLKISDTGSGMDEDTRKRIFDPYFTTKIRGKGTGLGLAVVHGIVKKLKGEITVKSEKGKGTELSIYLPRVGAGKEDTREKPDLSSIPSLGDKNILAVDDEEAVLSLLDQILSRTGCKTTCLSSSAKALELFQASPGKFDLLITDMTMPDLTGDKLLSKVKAIRPDIPVVLCSGFNEALLNEKAEGIKPDKLLMKPVTKSDLMKALAELLDK